MASTTEQLDRSGRLARGQVRNVRPLQFFGQKFNIPQMVESFLWNGPIDFTFTDYTTDRITHVSSSSVSDTGQIQVFGLDENWDEVVQIATLNGQNKVALTTELIRLNRAVSLKDLIGNVYIYEDGTITGGIPDDLNTVKGYIAFDINETKSSVYSVPKNYQLNFKRANFGTLPITSGCCFRFRNFIRFFGGATVMVFESPVVSSGTTFIIYGPETAYPILEKSDIFVKVFPSLPNSAVSYVFEGELLKV